MLRLVSLILLNGIKNIIKFHDNLMIYTKKNPYANLLELWGHVDSRNRKFGYLVFALMIISSLAEFISIGAIFPFLAAVINPDKIFQNPKFSTVVVFFGCNTAREFLAIITIGFCLAAIFAAITRIFLMCANAKYSFGLGAVWGSKMFEKTLRQPYEVHLSQSSSLVISGIISKTDALIHYGVAPVLIIASSSLILFAILCIFLYIDLWIGLIIIIGFGLTYVTIIAISRKKLIDNSKVVASNSVTAIKILQESLGGIRDILIDANQSYFCEQFKKADNELRQAQRSSHVISTTPRYAVEAIGIIALVLTAFYFSSEEDSIRDIIPLLGVFALGAQKVLPLAQQIFSALSSIKGGSASVRDGLNLLNQPIPNNIVSSYSPKLRFKECIRLHNVSFRYQGRSSEPVLKNINLRINKGLKVGIIGSTGSGKSTLIDLLMGLLQSTEGQLYIDGEVITEANSRQWMSKIAHVPQSIYLSDSTIAENIAFGLPFKEINFDRIKLVSQIAEADKFISSLDLGFQTQIGERGVKLSGGQRQRIGLARALYKNSEIIVLDEATSALDNDTEARVMANLIKLDKELTLIIIAHRLSTLSGCDLIIKINSGRLEKMGTYQEVIGQN